MTAFGALALALVASCSGGSDLEDRYAGASSDLSGAQPTSAGREYDFDEASQILDDLVVDRGLEGAGLLVVDRNDGVVHEEYWGDFNAERVSLVASASKMLTAGVLLRLADEGQLDLDAPLEEIVAWGSGNPDITPAQLLSNSSGLVGVFPDPTYLPYLCQFLPLGSLSECAQSIFLTREDDGQVVAPDTEFRYGGGQWQVAGAVAEAASGQPWAELIEETYLEPCGLSADSLGYNNPITQMGNGYDYPAEFAGDPSTLVDTDNPNLESGAYATPKVFSQLLLAYLNGGDCGDGGQLLTDSSIRRALRDRIGPNYEGNAAANRGYGLGWWTNRQTGLAYSVGAYGAVPAIHLDKGFGYYLVLEANDATWQAVEARLESAITAAIETSRAERP